MSSPSSRRFAEDVGQQRGCLAHQSLVPWNRARERCRGLASSGTAPGSGSRGRSPSAVGKNTTSGESRARDEPLLRRLGQTGKRSRPAGRVAGGLQLPVPDEPLLSCHHRWTAREHDLAPSWWPGRRRAQVPPRGPAGRGRPRARCSGGTAGSRARCPARAAEISAAASAGEGSSRSKGKMNRVSSAPAIGGDGHRRADVVLDPEMLARAVDVRGLGVRIDRLEPDAEPADRRQVPGFRGLPDAADAPNVGFGEGPAVMPYLQAIVGRAQTPVLSRPRPRRSGSARR